MLFVVVRLSGNMTYYLQVLMKQLLSHIKAQSKDIFANGAIGVEKLIHKTQVLYF